MQFPAAVNFFALLPRWLNLNRSGGGAHAKACTSSLNALHNLLAKPQRLRTTAHVSYGGDCQGQRREVRTQQWQLLDKCPRRKHFHLLLAEVSISNRAFPPLPGHFACNIPFFPRSVSDFHQQPAQVLTGSWHFIPEVMLCVTKWGNTGTQNLVRGPWP